MKKINYLLVKNDLINKFKDQFLTEFKELTPELNKLIEKPFCSVCIKGFFEKLKAFPNRDEIVSKIYGEPVTIDFRGLIKIRKQNIKTEYVPLTEWENWFVASFKDVRIFKKFMSTMLDNDGNTVIVTYINTYEVDQEDIHV